MPIKIPIVETPNGLAKECSDCHEVKLLHFFVKDGRRPEGRGQPCAECKSKYDIARRKGIPTAHEAKQQAKKKAKVATAKPATKPAVTGVQQLREVGKRGGAARAAKDAKANTHPQPPTAAEKSSLLYAKAGRALREAWKHIDPERYEQDMDRLTNQYPCTDATEHQHKLFHAYCEGVIKRYGG